jgi:hypothetical protein
MKRQANIEALLRKARAEFGQLRSAYDKALQAKTISEDLKVDLKNIFENLRSCLDYLAHEISETLCRPPKSNQLYFPIRASEPEFRKVMSDQFDGLEQNAAALFSFLESIQPCKQSWLGQFNRLNNGNKHQDLVEQTRTETVMVNVASPSGASVTWNPANVRFGSGVWVAGVPVDPRTQMPVPNNQAKTTVTKWIDFKFAENGESVLPFVQRSIDQVQTIFDEAKKYL